MNDQHVSAVATIWQVVLLAINAGLFFWYLIETNKLRTAAEKQVETSSRQVEATFRPALIVTHDGITAHKPRLENIGTGPATDVAWSLRGSDRTGMIPFLRSGAAFELAIDMREIFQALMRTQAPDVVISCEYKSLSGPVHLHFPLQA
jgi:hypothetical protein